MKNKKVFPKKIIFGLFAFAFVANYGVSLILNGGGIYWEEWFRLVYFFWGIMMGGLTLFLDRLVDIYITNPETKLAFFVKKLIYQKKYKEAIKILKDNAFLQTKLTIRSMIFQVIWVFLAIFIIFSERGFFSIGYILTIGLWLILSEWEDYLSDKDKLKKWLCWQINKDFSDKNIKQYLIGISIFWFVCFLSIIY